MNGLLKILFLEDVFSDAELNWYEIEKKGIRFERLLVDNRKDFLKGLKSFKPDIIISDYSLPQFDGMKALLLRNEISPLTPFIIVTGSMNEEVAVECMKAGADDYVIKEHLTRLPFAVKEALEKYSIMIEKRAAELLLKENEEKLQSIFSAAPVGIGLVVNNILIEVNNTFCEMTGYNLRELIGKPVEMIFSSAEQKESAWQLIYNQITEKNTASVECRLKCKAGSILNIILSSSPLDKDDLSKGITFIAMDITERAHAEEALANEKYLIYALLNTLPDHIYFKDLESRFIRINMAHAKSFGLSDPIEAQGKTDFDFFTEQHAQQAYMDEQTIICTGQPLSIEEIETHHNSPDSWVSTIKMPLRNNEGDIIGTFGISRDITERKETELALLKSEEKFRTIMENSADPIFITDSQAKYIYTNKAVTVMLGYTTDEMLTKTIMDLTPPDLITEYFEIFKKILTEGKIITEIELLKKDGSFIPTDLNSVLLPGGLVYGSCRDITERKLVQQELTRHRDHLRELVDERTEELNNAKKEAEEANRAKSDFLANMSHEIRTPMNAVLGYTELLSTTSLDHAQKDYINSINSSGKSLLKLINDILDLSKIEAGKLELEYTYVDIYSFFYEFERIFSLKVSEKGLKLILEIASGTPSGLYIDEARMRQIVLNLLGNAIKFTSKGIIKLKVLTSFSEKNSNTEEKNENKVDLIIEVNDTGIGISQDLQDAIFEPFVQERGSANYGGTGLGLTISRRLAGLMKGSVSVQSEQGKGSKFTIRIPEIEYRNDSPEESFKIQVSPENIEFRESTILIVDDVDCNRSFIRDALKNTNLKISEAADGVAAYEIALEIIPDLIIADIKMPKMDGFQLLNKIKDNRKLKQIPVIAYSAMVLRDQKEQIFNSKFADLLIKPVKVTELYNALMTYLPYKMKNVTVGDEENQIWKSGFLEEVSNFSELIHTLETDFQLKMESFSVRQPIGEIRAFGEGLISLGMNHNSVIVSGYGKELVSATDSFNIEAILMLLGKFNGIIKRLKEPVNKVSHDK